MLRTRTKQQRLLKKRFLANKYAKVDRGRLNWQYKLQLSGNIRNIRSLDTHEGITRPSIPGGKSGKR